MPDEQQAEEMTKCKFRQSTWEHIIKNVPGNYPPSSYKRLRSIPNFKGTEDAAKRLTDLPEFKNAKVIKVNPDNAQKSVTIMALEAGKDILIPIPRLKAGLFLHVIPPVDSDKNIDIKSLTSRQELSKHGKPLGVDANVKVDLVVMGAVCVSRLGHRIGKGEGFADLEFAMMMKIGAVNQDTIVVTTVHDCQIIDDIPPRLFEKHDVPVDIIVTPTQTIYVNERLKKPEGIFWDILTMRRIKTMQILQQFKEMDEKEGKEIVLKPDDPKDHYRRKRFDKNFARKLKERKRSKSGSKDNEENIKTKDNNEKENDGRKDRPIKKRQGRSKKSEKTDSPGNENNEKNVEKPRGKQTKYRQKSDIDFSLKLSNIGSSVRVRDLKNALNERGVRPTDITWRGHRGFCFLHFGKLRNKNSVPNQPVQVDSIVANLQQLKIGETSSVDNEFIIVEPAKPITRIEITDVTAV